MFGFLKRVFCVTVLASAASFSVFASMPGVFYVYEPDRKDMLTSSGQVFYSDKLTVAHPSLPFGTQLQLSYEGRIIDSVVVNDRIEGDDNVFACSKAIADKLGFNCAAVVNYAVTENGDGNTSWNGRDGNPWYMVRGLLSDNIFDLYRKLSFKGYKLKYDNGLLDVLFIVEHRLPLLKKDIAFILGNNAQFDVVKMEQSPVRE